MMVQTSRDFYNQDNRKHLAEYGSGAMAERNTLLCKMMQSIRHLSSVLELGGADGDLAYQILSKRPLLKYCYTDFSSVAVEQAKVKLSMFPFCELREEDATAITKQTFQEFKCVVSTILCHIKDDVELINKIPSGSFLALSLENYAWDGHFRWFENFAEIEKRYPMLIFIQEEKFQAKAAFSLRLTNYLKTNLPSSMLKLCRKAHLLRRPVSKQQAWFLALALKR